MIWNIWLISPIRTNESRQVYVYLFCLIVSLYGNSSVLLDFCLAYKDFSKNLNASDMILIVYRSFIGTKRKVTVHKQSKEEHLHEHKSSRGACRYRSWLSVISHWFKRQIITIFKGFLLGFKSGQVVNENMWTQYQNVQLTHFSRPWSRGKMNTHPFMLNQQNKEGAGLVMCQYSGISHFTFLLNLFVLTVKVWKIYIRKYNIKIFPNYVQIFKLNTIFN